MFLAFQLTLPLCVGLRQSEILAAVMPMPEAAVHEYHRPVFSQHEVGMPWQSRMVEPIAEPTSEQVLPNHHLGLRVLALDGGHILVVLFWICESIYITYYCATLSSFSLSNLIFTISLETLNSLDNAPIILLTSLILQS